MSAKMTLSIETPRVPNFVRPMLSRGHVSDMVVDVADLDDDTLREIGRQWTEALIRCAENRRRLKPHPSEECSK